MKKRQLKAIRTLSKILPESYTEVSEGQNKFGYELLREKISVPREFQKYFDPDRLYPIKVNKLVKINHYRKIKKSYKSNGQQGIMDYMKWLDAHNAQLAKKYQLKKIKRIDQRLLEIAMSSAEGFWQSIITFIIAFTASFLTSDEEE